MADESKNDRSFGAGEFHALADVRAALEGVEQEQGRVVRELRRLLDRHEGLLSALGDSGVVLSFDTGGTLTGASGAVDRFFGISSSELVFGFDDIAPLATREMLREHSRKALDSGATLTECDGSLLCRGEERAFRWIHLPRSSVAGGNVGVDVVGLPASDISEVADGSEASDAFEALFVETAQRIIDDPSDASIGRALSELGEAFAADRVVVSGYEEDGRRFSVRSSWLRDGTEPLGAETRGISISEIPWAYSQLGAGETVLISESIDLSADAVAEKRLYATEGSKTSLLVPIVRNDMLSGFVSIQSALTERDWSDAQLAEARRFGMLLSAALARASSLAELESARDEAREAISRVAEAERRVDRADAKARAGDQRIEEISDEAEKLRSRVAELEAENETVRQQAGAARELFDAADERIREAEEAADDARSELDGAKQEVVETRRGLEKLGEEAERAQRRSEDTAADALAARKECEEARAEAEEARREAAEARARLQTLLDETSGDVPAAAPDAEESAVASQEVSLSELDRGIEAATGAETGPEPDLEPQELVSGRHEADISVELGGPDFDPDSTVELSTRNFDPDATLEIELSKLTAGVEPAEAESDGPDANGDSGETLEAELTRAPGLEQEAENPPRASRLDGILETTQALEKSASDADTSIVDSDAERAESADVARDLEAARQMARQVAGKADDASADDAVAGGEAELPANEPPLVVDGERDVVVEPAWQTAAPDATDDAAISDLDTEPPAAPSVPELPGIDSTIGLQDVGGNVELYRNLLSKFRQDYVGAVAKIESAIAKGNIEVAHLLLHAIKGVAGMLGAQRVRSTAEDLETSLIGRDETKNQAALAAFTGALEEALESIASLDEGAELPSGNREETPAADTHVSDPMVLRSYLSGLRQHLLAEKPKQCELVMREITARTWPGELNERVTELADLVSTQQFDDARQTFEDLMSTLKED